MTVPRSYYVANVANVSRVANIPGYNNPLSISLSHYNKINAKTRQQGQKIRQTLLCPSILTINTLHNTTSSIISSKLSSTPTKSVTTTTPPHFDAVIRTDTVRAWPTQKSK